MRNEAAALAVWLVAGAGVACEPGAADLRLGDTRLRFQVEVADDEAERARGLMFRESMPRFSGMLFVYDREQPVSFWMRNTLIPLDMLFFDETGRLARVQENAVPGDLTPITGGAPARYVLELNGGAAASLGLRPGAELRHPALDQDQAAWPCAGE